jgi:hypothetical protein
MERYSVIAARYICFMIRIFKGVIRLDNSHLYRPPNEDYTNFNTHATSYISSCAANSNSASRQRALLSMFLSSFIDEAEISANSDKFGCMLFVILLAAEDRDKPLHSEAARSGIAALLYIYRLFMLYYLNFNNSDNLFNGETIQFDIIQGRSLTLSSRNFSTYVTNNRNTPFDALTMAQKLCKVSVISIFYDTVSNCLLDCCRQSIKISGFSMVKGYIWKSKL